MVLTQDEHTTPNHCITESAMSVARLLLETGSYPGAFFIILYAMIIPAVKLIVLCISEYYRKSSSTEAVRWSRRGIILVQYISKWACPDMFAYILLLYLLRKIPENTDTISAPAKLDIGFSCFSAFCVLSTFACLYIKPPDLPEIPEDRDDAPTAPFVVRVLGEKGREKAFFALAVLAFLAFLAILLLGMSWPCMGLQISSKAFIEPNGPAPKSLAPVIYSLNLDETMSAKVNVWHCLYALVDWAWTNGEGNCVFALIMFGLFAITLPICNMFAITLAAFQIHDFDKQNSDGKLPEEARWDSCRSTMKVVKFLGHISMLDVFIMGVVVVTFAASMYKKMGVIFTLEHGVIMLFLAEVVHYATYYIICGVVEQKHSSAVKNV